MWRALLLAVSYVTAAADPTTACEASPTPAESSMGDGIDDSTQARTLCSCRPGSPPETLKGGYKKGTDVPLLHVPRRVWQKEATRGADTCPPFSRCQGSGSSN